MTTPTKLTLIVENAASTTPSVTTSAMGGAAVASQPPPDFITNATAIQHLRLAVDHLSRALEAMAVAHSTGQSTDDSGVPAAAASGPTHDDASAPISNATSTSATHCVSTADRVSRVRPAWEPTGRWATPHARPFGAYGVQPFPPVYISSSAAARMTISVVRQKRQNQQDSTYKTEIPLRDLTENAFARPMQQLKCDFWIKVARNLALSSSRAPDAIVWLDEESNKIIVVDDALKALGHVVSKCEAAGKDVIQLCVVQQDGEFFFYPHQNPPQPCAQELTVMPDITNLPPLE